MGCHSFVLLICDLRSIQPKICPAVTNAASSTCSNNSFHTNHESQSNAKPSAYQHVIVNACPYKHTIASSRPHQHAITSFCTHEHAITRFCAHQHISTTNTGTNLHSVSYPNTSSNLYAVSNTNSFANLRAISFSGIRY
jgi:hypothetical protein